MSQIEIFIVHYKPLVERKQYLDNALKSYGFTNIHWFEDIDRNTMSQEQLSMYKYNADQWYELNSTWYQFDSKPRLLTKPEIACTVSHILIYKYIIDNNIEKALIFEDDCILLDNFLNKLEKVLNELPADFCTCYLNDAFGWTVSNFKHGFLGSLNKNIYSPDKCVYNMSCSRCSDSFILSNRGAKLLYNNITKTTFCLPIDWTHNPIYLTTNHAKDVFWAEPALTHQGSEGLSEGSTSAYKSSVQRNNQPISEQKPPLIKYIEPNPEKILYYQKIKGETTSNKYALLELESTKRLLEFTARIRTYSNFILCRMGDGEMRSMISENELDHNCDGCFYYKPLGLDLIKAYIYFLENNDAYIGRWHSHVYKIQDQIDKDFKESFNENRKFVFFDLINHKLTSANTFKSEIIQFYRTIKESPRKKIYISNLNMFNAVKPLLNLDYGIIIPEVNSYLLKTDILKTIRDLFEDKLKIPDMIILVSAGMFGKVIISEISQLFPENTYIDLGSAFDGLIKHSRDFNGSLGYREALLKSYS